MTSIDSSFLPNTSSKSLERYFWLLQQRRARPIIQIALTIGTTISLLYLIYDWIIQPPYFDQLIILRLTLLSGLILIYVFCFIAPRRFHLPHSIGLTFAIGLSSAILSLIHIGLYDNPQGLLASLTLCLLALLMVQLGQLLMWIGVSFVWLAPIIFGWILEQTLSQMMPLVLPLSVWAICALVASSLLEKHNKKLFQFERGLYEINKVAVKAQEDEAQASLAKSRFLANMSHEIRTPLTAIMGYAESLLSDQCSVDDIRNASNIIYRNGQHLLSIINDILDLSRVESGKLSVEIIEHPLLDILDSVEAVMSQLAKANKTQFTCQWKYPLPKTIHTDPTRVRQVLINLLGNAFKFSVGRKVEFVVSVNEDRNQLSFSISDNGIGMSQNVIQQIFKPFTQADVSTSRKYGGTGLGLHIAYQLALSLKGHLKVKSVEGQGSEFTFSLPLDCTKDCEWLTEKTNVSQQILLARKGDQIQLVGHVLLAEDHPENAELIRSLLTNIGLTVKVVNNGEQAVELAVAEHFNLILMDLQMPIMDGKEAIQLIKASGVDSPIIALSANVSSGNQNQYQSLGCVNYLSKPIVREEFFRTLKLYLPSQNKLERTGSQSDRFKQSSKFLDLKRRYMLQLYADLVILNRNIGQGNFSDAKNIAHRIKGSAGNFELIKVSQFAGEIESSILHCQQTLQSSLDGISRTLQSIDTPTKEMSAHYE